eukprot:GHVT01034323.1.p1 GENE.GHVT01034323.1~~GHVT01034323.1.p1  ORF type:complete len:205 (-),score=28.76 GHVT01034323.1:1686-2300(-)
MTTPPGTPFPILRVTLLGGSDSGKTSVISSFVNQSCPSAHHATTLPRFHYRTCRLPPIDEGMQAGSFQSVVVELEDSYSSDNVTDGRDFRIFMNMRRITDSTKTGSKSKKAVPFSNLSIPPAMTRPSSKHRGLAAGRMAYLVVFDASRMKSFEEAMRIISTLTELVTFQAMVLRPIIHLVANKIDKAAGTAEQQQVISQAEFFA